MRVQLILNFYLHFMNNFCIIIIIIIIIIYFYTINKLK